jgi:hypothetical protein
MRHRLPIAATLAVGLAAVAASPAAAQSLSLTGPSAGAVGAPSVLQATGTVPADAFLTRYINVYAIPASVVGTCPADFQNAMQLGYATAAQGGDTVALAVPVEGSFSIPVAYTPAAAGRFILCGYLHELAVTEAMSQHAIDVSGGGGVTPGAAMPANTSKPKVKRSGRKLVCTRGAWSGSPTSYAYQWRVKGERRNGATKRTLRVTRKLKGKKVSCGVTATNAAGSVTALSRNKRVR